MVPAAPGWAFRIPRVSGGVKNRPRAAGTTEGLDATTETTWHAGKPEFHHSQSSGSSNSAGEPVATMRPSCMISTRSPSARASRTECVT